MVFTEFFDMVRSAHSEDLVDDLLDTVPSSTGGAYTAVGTYDHAELVGYVAEYCKLTDTSVSDALFAFGHYLFGRFRAAYGGFFEGVNGSFEFLSRIEEVIHAEVLKLYPDAELPRFTVERHDGDYLILRYESVRHLEDLASGLIAGTIEYYQEEIQVSRESTGDGAERFVLRRVGAS